MLVLIKGAGDLATGIACRLVRSGFQVIMTELEKPTTVRCTVAFSRAVYNGETIVENIKCVRAHTVEEALRISDLGMVAVIVDPDGYSIQKIQPDAVVDATLKKENISTKISEAASVIGVGPGFTAGMNCHAAIETQRGHDLGRVLYEGSTAPNTGIPGKIEGYSTERLILASADGIFERKAEIGDKVKAGQIVAMVCGVPVAARIDGVIRGLLPTGTKVYNGMKSGDVDPRARKEYCFSVSDKALAIGGGVLEAILHFASKKQ